MLILNWAFPVEAAPHPPIPGPCWVPPLVENSQKEPTGTHEAQPTPRLCVTCCHPQPHPVQDQQLALGAVGAVT